jgi:hypothetical protein
VDEDVGVEDVVFSHGMELYRGAVCIDKLRVAMIRGFWAVLAILL